MRAAVLQGPGQRGGRAGADRARRLALGERFDPEAERLVDAAATLDRIYGRDAGV